MESSIKFTRHFVLEFAGMARELPGDLEGLFDDFLENYIQEPLKPDNNNPLYMEVLTAAAEMCNVTMEELSSGRKYGDIPTAKQLTAIILHELKFTEKEIATNLPMLGLRITVHQQAAKAAEYEESDKSFRVVLNQLREKFGLLDEGVNNNRLKEQT